MDNLGFLAAVTVGCCGTAVCAFSLAVYLLSRAEIEESRRISSVNPMRSDVDELDIFGDEFE